MGYASLGLITSNLNFRLQLLAYLTLYVQPEVYLYLATTTTITAPSLCRINIKNNVLDITEAYAMKGKFNLSSFLI